MEFFPLRILREAIKAVPAVRYALGVAGIVAAVAIIKSFKVDYKVAIFGGLIVVIFMFILLIFSSISGPKAKKSLRIPALVLAWAFLILTVSSSFLLASSAFFQWPLNFEEKNDQSESIDVTIEGIVNDENSKPIIGAKISIDGEVNFSATSKTNGKFSSKLRGVYLGKSITLRARCDGYTSYSEDREIEAKSESFEISLEKIND